MKEPSHFRSKMEGGLRHSADQNNGSWRVNQVGEDIITREDHLVRKCVPRKEPYLRKTSPPTTISAPVKVTMGQLQHVHPVVPNLILNLEMRNFPLAGRLEHLLKATQKFWSGFQV